MVWIGGLADETAGRAGDCTIRENSFGNIGHNKVESLRFNRARTQHFSARKPVGRPFKSPAAAA
jgi:hypothetical protein